MRDLVLGPGLLTWRPALASDAGLAAPVQAALDGLRGAPAVVADIDAELADTAAFGERYGVRLRSRPIASSWLVAEAGRPGTPPASFWPPPGRTSTG